MVNETQSMSNEQIKVEMLKIRGKMQVLEWDNSRNQINPYKKMELDKLRKDYEDLQERLEALEVEM